jgi:hypothetical protein
MTDVMTITLKAVVGESERAAVSQAAMLLESSLSIVSAKSVAVRCLFEESLSALKASEERCVVVTSMLPEVANHDRPWTAVADRLWASYRDLVGCDVGAAFVCTVFRHVPAAEDDARSRLARIRRLNLLVAELSRETGIFVIDLDRSLADIGALKLQTDYRLTGQDALNAVAKEIAVAVVSAGLDEYLPFEILDAAKVIITQGQPSSNAIKATELEIVPSNVLSLGAGRRKQVVATVVDTNPESHASWLIHLLLTRRFSLKEAVAKMNESIARRGVRASFVMVSVALWQVLRRRPRMGR